MAIRPTVQRNRVNLQQVHEGLKHEQQKHNSLKHDHQKHNSRLVGREKFPTKLAAADFSLVVVLLHVGHKII
ncbi:hypothetical protein BDR05DRAFT_963921 [Suillus weaverae]|nr:hypothetical protein BDR05DRAFT_963921 [Suillus weaverae]